MKKLLTCLCIGAMLNLGILKAQPLTPQPIALPEAQALSQWEEKSQSVEDAEGGILGTLLYIAIMVGVGYLAYEAVSD